MAAKMCAITSYSTEKLASTSRSYFQGQNALNLFFGRASELQIYHGNILLVDNEHRKSFVTEQSNECKFMSKIH